MPNHATSFVIALALCFGSACSGYLVAGGPAPTRTGMAQPSCHPSQYWDGQQCRHKGRGHGVRKHDGR